MAKRKQQADQLASDEAKVVQPSAANTGSSSSGSTAKKQRRGSQTAASLPAKPTATTNGSRAQLVASGFYATPISFPSTSIQPTPTHYLYCRAHSASTSARSARHGTAQGDGDDDDDRISSQDGGSKKVKKEDLLPAGRTLFCVNLPVDTTEKHLRALFKKAGTIHSVVFQQLRSVPGFYPGVDDEEELYDEEDEEEGGEDAADQIQDQAGKGKGKGKGKEKRSRKPRGPPAVIALPSMDARIAKGSEPLLTTASSAYVVFLDESSLERALEQLKAGQVRAWPDPFKGVAAAALEAARTEATPTDMRNRHAKTASQFAAERGAADHIPPLGLQYLLDQHRLARPPMEAVKAFADSTIARFAYIKAHPPPKRAGVKGVTVGPDGELLDEDGFTIVQRGGKTGAGYGFAEGGLGTVKASRVKFGRERASDSEANNTKNKGKDLENFYRFQVREKKREKLAELRAQFEADKAKVAKLKASRRFNPY